MLAETLSKCFCLHGYDLTHINTNRYLLSHRSRFRLLALVVQTLFFYGHVLSLYKYDAVIFVASSGGSFFLKIVPAAVVCRLFRVATVLDFVGGGVEKKLAKNPVLWKRCFSCFGEVIVPTAVFQKLFSRYGIHTIVLPHIIDIERFSSDKLKGSKSVLLAAKSLVAYSGIETIIRAFHKVCLQRTDVELVIAGDGPDRERLDILVKGLELTNVTFLGNVSYGEMPELFQKATIFVHGTKLESFGMVLVEAFASGTPVVSTNVGGIPEVVSDGVNGYLVEHGDYHAMAQKIKDLLSSDELYSYFRIHAIDEAKKYSCATLSPRYLNLIEREIAKVKVL